jgi:hypothetical protein
MSKMYQAGLPSVQEQIDRHNTAVRAAITETRTPYGSIFRTGDREWFPGTEEEFRTAKAWEHYQRGSK